jgi:hypothetical protein
VIVPVTCTLLTSVAPEPPVAVMVIVPTNDVCVEQGV